MVKLTEVLLKAVSTDKPPNVYEKVDRMSWGSIEHRFIDVRLGVATQALRGLTPGCGVRRHLKGLLIDPLKSAHTSIQRKTSKQPYIFTAIGLSCGCIINRRGLHWERPASERGST